MPESAGERVNNPNTQRVERLRSAVQRFQDRALVERRAVRDYQNSALVAVGNFLEKAVRQVEAGNRASGAIVMPGGSGKTVVAAEIARAIGLKAMVLAPTIKIAFQDYQELIERANLKTSIYYKGRKDLSGQVIVTTYQSAVNLMRSGELPEDIDIVFYDEAHRSLSPERSKLHEVLGDIEIGLTATPAFNEDKHIWNIFDEKIYNMPLREAVEMGVLAPLRGFIIETNVDLSDVSIMYGHEALNEAEAEKHLNIIARNKAARDFYLDGFKGVPAIAFCVTQKHAEDFAKYLRKSEVKADHIHGKVPVPKREKILRKFEEGSLDVLTTRDVLLEGWDSNRVILEMNLRPTYSRVVKMQMVGRVLRVYPGKKVGIVAEFQDLYKRGEQPLLVHHVFEEPVYKQGGLILAPKEMKDKEEKELKEGKRIRVAGKLQVSYEIKEVFKVDRTERKREKIDFTNRKILREILLSRDDIDFTELSFTKFKRVKFYHPLFSGNGETLLRNWLRRWAQGEDYRHFLWYALENKIIQKDKVFTAEQLGGITTGDGEHTKGPEELVGKTVLVTAVKEALKTISRREEKAIRLYYGIEEEKHSTAEIAKLFRVSRKRLNQIIKKGRNKLRHHPRSRYLDWLGIYHYRM